MSGMTFGDQPRARVLDRRPDGFVEFAFSLDGADLWVEMIMSGSAFGEFCTENHVAISEPDEMPSPYQWGLHDARTWNPDQPTPAG